MATCYYLVNHTTREYLDLGARCAGSQGPLFHTRYGAEAHATTDAQVVEYLMGSAGQALEWASDCTSDLLFLDEYRETTLLSPVS